MKTELVLDYFFGYLKGRPSLLMLDYDGTLAPFNIDRDKALPYAGVRERLEDLLAIKDVKLVIISGRSLIDLEKLLNLKTMPELWGSHGLERKTDQGVYSSSKLNLRTRTALETAQKKCLDYLEPSRCEAKPFGLALHFRGLGVEKRVQIESVILTEWEKICESSDLEIHPFDGGLELRPKGKHKGEVVEALMAQFPTETPMAYLGDDATDEDAYRMLADKGLKVLVRKEFRPTLADIQLKPPEELIEFLDRWIESAHE